MKLLNVLIIDDHPQIAQSYKLGLKRIENDSEDYTFNITEASTIDRAYTLIVEHSTITYDLIFLDIKLPASKDGKLLSGEDLGLKIREHSPDSKIIVATTYNDNLRINNLFKSLDPEGLLIKNDLIPKALINAIHDVLEDTPAYSKTVKKFLRKFVTNDITLDQLDRKILYHLSLGARMVELPDLLPMSIGGIEKRKRLLKDAFGVSGKDDKILIEIAKEKGFI